MAERWQQWMPFHIDRFRGSPEVQAMHPAARWGYMSLLASQWQTEDCTLSPDALDLASASGLGDDLWAQYGPRILRKFPPLDIGGRLRNDVCHVEWKEAKRIFDARSAAAKRTTEIRSPRQKSTVTVQESDGHRAPTDTVTPRPADTITGTLTSTEKQKQKPSRVKRERKPANPKYTVFKGLIFDAWKEWENPLEPPWDGAEGKQLGMMLGANPKLGPEGFRRLLQYRARSHGVNLAERPSRWLRSLTDYAKGPLNKFRQPEETDNGANRHEPGITNVMMSAEEIEEVRARIEANGRKL